MDPEWIEFPDHTADEAVRVRAPDPGTLFERAAWGMFRIVCDPAAVREEIHRRVRVEAGDREALLVRWLSELNVLHQTENLLFCAFHARVAQERVFEAVVVGEPLDRARHSLHTEIKAVTFHGLRVAQQGDIWVAEVLFDV